MARKQSSMRSSGHRPGRGTARAEARSRRAAPTRGRAGGARTEGGSRDALRVYEHPLYGRIPIVERWVEAPTGKRYRQAEWDLDFCPAMPEGAVRGEPHRQEFCPACHVPKYFYVDLERHCLQCGEHFVFSAREQKFWYEGLKFHFDATAVRCRTCRRRRRDARMLRAQVQAAREGVSRAPDDPARQLALAEALVRLYEQTGAGRLSDAISAARRARRGSQGDRSSAPRWQQGASEASFWEGLAQVLAGRPGLGEPLLAAFVASGPGKGRLKGLHREAVERLGRAR